MVKCYDYIRGVRDYVEKICEDGQVCHTTWYQTQNGSIAIMSNECGNMNDMNPSRECGQDVCRLTQIVYKSAEDTYSYCDRGPGAVCCCMSDLCNNDVPAYNSSNFTNLCEEEEYQFNIITEAPSSLSSYTPYLILLMLFVSACITVFVILCIRENTTPSGVQIRRSMMATCDRPHICQRKKILRSLNECLCFHESDRTPKGEEMVSTVSWRQNRHLPVI